MHSSQALVLLATVLGTGRLHAQALETEDARTLPAGRLIVGYNFEYQTSSAGREIAIPFSAEIGLSDRLEFLIEPVPYTSIRPKSGPRATGAGDMEATLIGLLAAERGGRPAIALGAEVKFPTARNTLIGTGKTDVAGYLILSKYLGSRWDTHFNAGYTIQGKPAGASVGNLLSGALAVQFHVTPATELFSEVIANTTTGASGPENVLNPEVAGGEVFGSVGIGHNLTSGLFGSVSLTYDNSRAFLVRSGFTLRLH